MNKKTISTPSDSFYSQVLDLQELSNTHIIVPIQQGFYKPPRIMNIHISNDDCNAECIVCVHGNEDVYENRLQTDIKFLVAQVSRLLALRSSDGAYVIEEFHFDGDSSDPLIIRNVPALVTAIMMIKAAGRKVEIYTNGINLADNRFLDVLGLVDRITVSLNGTTPEEHWLFSRRKKFNDILNNIWTVSGLIKVHGYGTKMNISHVLNKDINYGRGNIDDLEALIRYLFTKCGVERYVFRFDMYEDNPFFMKSMRQKIDKVMYKLACEFGQGKSKEEFKLFLEKFRSRIMIKDFMTRREAMLMDGCIAPIYVNTMLPDGSITGCPHSARASTKLEPFAMLPITLSQLFVEGCSHTCPSHQLCMNKIFNYELGPKMFEGFTGEPSYIKKRLFLSELHDAEEPFVMSDHNYYFDILFDTPGLQLERFQMLGQGNKHMFFEIINADSIVGYVSNMFILDEYKNVIAVRSAAMPRFEAASQMKYITKEGHVVILQKQKVGETQEWTLITQDDPWFSVHAWPIDRPREIEWHYPHSSFVGKVRPANSTGKNFLEIIHDGTDLMVSRARKYSSYDIELTHVPAEHIDRINDALVKGRILFDQNVVAKYLHSVSDLLHVVVKELVKDASPENKRISSKHMFKNTCLDFEYFMKKAHIYAQYKEHKYDWFYPTNSVNERILNYLYWMKCFGRVAPYLNDTDNKCTEHGDGRELMMIIESFLKELNNRTDDMPPLDLIDHILNRGQGHYREIMDPDTLA